MAEVAAPPSVSCRIDVEEKGRYLRIVAVGRSAEPVNGQYTFVLIKRSAAGSANTRQSGKFSLAPGNDQVLATTVLEAEARGHFTAALTLVWGDQRVICTFP